MLDFVLIVLVISEKELKQKASLQFAKFCCMKKCLRQFFEGINLNLIYYALLKFLYFVKYLDDVKKAVSFVMSCLSETLNMSHQEKSTYMRSKISGCTIMFREGII